MVLLQPSKQGGYQRETLSNLPNFSAFPGSITHLNAQRAEVKAEVLPKNGAQVGNLMHVQNSAASVLEQAWREA